MGNYGGSLGESQLPASPSPFSEAPVPDASPTAFTIRRARAQSAQDWNTRDPASGYVSYVIRFEVLMEFLERYPVQQVGAALHTEYWIPAADLEEFNRQLVGRIELIREFHGE